MSYSHETISGLIERVTFHSEESGFCVLKVNVKAHKDLVSIIGTLATVRAGEWLEAHGNWIQDKQYGQQFKAETMLLTAPSSLEGIEKYLGSGLIKGIGSVYAKKLVQAFKDDVFEVIENNPELLKSVSGIGTGRMDRIVKSWSEQKVIRSIMVFLHSYGISTSRSVRIYKTYGNEAIQLIKDNPYRLAKDIRGIGFISADKIALSMGVEKESIIRARAGLAYTLAKAMDEGHCGLPVNLLLDKGQDLLEIGASVLEEALDLELQERILKQAFIDEISCVFLAGLYNAEIGIAERIKAIQRGILPWKEINAEDAIASVEKDNGIVLSKSQKQAISTVLQNKVTIVTGGPGVGKTTLLSSILKILNKCKMKLALCAPTGRAAKRMMEATGFEAKTIHRLLNINPETGKFSYNEEHCLECDVLIIDEVSMIDVQIMHGLMKALPAKAAVIMVGDQDQLPSVGAGQVLKDMIASKSVSCIYLTETFRQAVSSQIIQASRQINTGKMPYVTSGQTSDFFLLEEEDPEKALGIIVDLVTRRLPHKYGLSPLSDIQVLCPMTRGIVGARNINPQLQFALNAPDSQISIQKFGNWYSVGDKVMQIANNYQKEVFNGDVGIISNIDKEESELTIEFEGRNVVYEWNELDEIVLAYAMTIHKSQGSEYPVVIIPIMMQHYTMLQKNLIYTGITRGKKLVILVGQKKALSIAVNNKSTKRRWTMLERHLCSIV